MEENHKKPKTRKRCKSENENKEHKCKSQCKLITEDVEKRIYDLFCSLDECKKTEFVNNMIKMSSYYNNSNREFTVHRTYFLPISSTKTTVRVCKQTFLRILRLPKTYLVKGIKYETVPTPKSKTSAVHNELKNSIPKVIIKTRKLSLPDLRNKSPSKIMVKIPKQSVYSPSHLSTSPESTIENSMKKHHNCTISTEPTSTISKPHPKSVQGDNCCKSFTITSEPPEIVADAAVQTDVPIDEIKNQDVNLHYPLKIVFEPQLLDRSHFILQMIRSNPLLFLGIPNTSWIKDVCENINCTETQLFMVFYKIRHNCTLSLLAFYFNQTENDVIKILNFYTPLVQYVLFNILDWQDANNIANAIPLDLKFKFGNLRSILKLVRVQVASSLTFNKFFISITPLGLISYVSEIYTDDVDNITMMNKSDFLMKAPKKCGIIVDNDLRDTEELLKKNGFTVFLDRSVEDTELMFSGDSFLKRDIKKISRKTELAYAKFTQFRILNYFLPFEFEDDKALYYVATIIAELVNIQMIQAEVDIAYV